MNLATRTTVPLTPPLISTSFNQGGDLFCGIQVLDEDAPLPSFRLVIYNDNGTPIFQDAWRHEWEPTSPFFSGAFVVYRRASSSMYFARNVKTLQEAFVLTSNDNGFHRTSADGRYLLTVGSTRMSYFDLTDVLHSRTLWSKQLSPNQGLAPVFDAKISSTGIFVAYYDQQRVGSDLTVHNLHILNRSGSEIAYADTQLPVEGLVFSGDRWLFSGVQYGDEGLTGTTRSTTTRIRLFDLSRLHSLTDFRE